MMWCPEAMGSFLLVFLGEGWMGYQTKASQDYHEKKGSGDTPEAYARISARD